MVSKSTNNQSKKGSSNTAGLGFEEKLWATADKMRNNMDPAEYKHVILGLIFLKYISDSFEEKHKKLSEDEYSEAEDRDEYLAEGIFWVPKEARWSHLKNSARSPDIGKLVDEAMVAIEKDNSSLRGVLPKHYARPDLDKTKLGEIIDLISEINVGTTESRAKDMLGRIYEYFIGRFASAEGKGGGEFYTPSCVVRLLVEMLEPYKGRVFDPCCGSGGMFVQSEKFIEEHGGNKDDVAIYGQESNPTTWRLAQMNLAIRGISGDLGQQQADSFHNDQHKHLKADFILANPPFNISDWGGERLKDDIRWKYGLPPAGNANYAWIQHFIHHLAPAGIAGFVMANGSLSSNTSGEGEIRKELIKKGLVDCIVALPDKLFYTTGIPACLWFVSRDRYNHKFRDRHDEILFIDARKLGTMVTRKLRELSEEEIKRIAGTYHQWRSKVPEAPEEGKYEDIKGFSKAASIEEVEKNSFVLTPGRYVGFEIEEEDEEVFEEKMTRLTKELSEQFAESKLLEERIRRNLEGIGFGLK
jgi:type I restriction enzyme M protein